MNDFEFEAAKIEGEAKQYVHMPGAPEEVGAAADRMMYDVTDFLKQHPGGEAALQAAMDQAQKMDPTLPTIHIDSQMLMIQKSGKDPEQQTHVFASSLYSRKIEADKPKELPKF